MAIGTSELKHVLADGSSVQSAPGPADTTPGDLARIRFVTRRFQELQGLYMVVSAGWLALWIWMGALATPGLFARDWLTSLLAMVVVCIPPSLARAYLQHYYASTFGRLPKEYDVPWDRLAAMVLGVALAVAAQGGLDFTAVYAGFALVYLWIAVRDRPFRNYHVLGGAGCMPPWP